MAWSQRYVTNITRKNSTDVISDPCRGAMGAVKGGAFDEAENIDLEAPDCLGTAELPAPDVHVQRMQQAKEDQNCR